MSEENNQACTHDCSTCSLNCSSRENAQHEEHSSTNNDFQAPLNAHSKVKRVIGVVSGKGGVGKSLVTSLLACAMQKKGRKSAVLDADITGPSIPKAFGVKGPAYASEEGIVPVVGDGVKIMSINLLMEEEDAPVVWRGPVIAGTVKQFWTDVMWGDVDYMFVDMPPGTGDVPLTVFQSLPLDGIVIVTSPQDLVSMIVGKAVNMAKMMNIPILGIVENYSYLVCDHCGEKMSVFGESHIEEVAEKYGTRVLAKLPIVPAAAKLVDSGKVAEISMPEIDPAVDVIERQMALV